MKWTSGRKDNSIDVGCSNADKKRERDKKEVFHKQIKPKKKKCKEITK